MAINLREKAVKVIVGIEDGKKVLKEVNFDNCKISEMINLLEFSKGEYSYGVVHREFFNKVDSRYNPEEVAAAKRFIKKMRGDQYRIKRGKNIEEE